jgi:hypothetical protein
MAVAAVVAVALAAGAVVGSAAGAGSSGAGSRARRSVRTSASNQAAAQTDAAKLLAAIRIPAGATPSATEPVGDDHQLARPATRPATPNLVIRHDWWTVAGDESDVLSYIKAHAPAGAQSDFAGAAGGPNVPANGSVGFDWRAIAGVLAQRTLVVNVVQLPGRTTGIRADAEDVWITPRPRSERIPGDITRLTVTVTGGGKTKRAPVVFSSSRRIGAAAAVINSLPLFPPGTYSCPADWGVEVELAFYAGSRTDPVAVAKLDASGCQTVSFRLDGRREPALAGWGSAATKPALNRVEKALSLHLHTGRR